MSEEKKFSGASQAKSEDLVLALHGATKGAEIISRLDPTIEIQAAHIESIRQFEARGRMRYSNEDCDVYGAAAGATRKTVVAPYERVWVERMLGRASA